MTSTIQDESQRGHDGVAGGSSRRADRIAYWPIGLTVGWALLIILAWSGPFKLLMICVPLVAFLWVLSAVVSLFAAALNAYDRAWRRALSIMILPAITLAAAMNLWFSWQTGVLLGAYVHFFVMRPVYLHEIAKLPADEPRLKIFPWSTWFLSATEVVYDESDEVVRPSGTQSEDWMKRAAGTNVAAMRRWAVISTSSPSIAEPWPRR